MTSASRRMSNHGNRPSQSHTIRPDGQGQKWPPAVSRRPWVSALRRANSFTKAFCTSSVPGRTDRLPISVAGGSYILPADHVAALGQGNSLAGANIVNKLFRMGPAGSAPTTLHAAHAPVPHLNLTPKAAKFADGGHGKPTKIIAAGGEISIPPHKIIERFGSLEKGHKALDQWVVNTRKKGIKTLRGLKPPRTD